MKHYIFYAALSILLLGCSGAETGELILVEPGNSSKFAFPYFLFIPNGVAPNGEVHLVIEPNNSGFVDDGLSRHLAKAKRTASRDFYLGNYVARKLGCPLLVPAFPRPETEWHIYTHALDRDVMLQQEGPLQRIDQQLIHMFEDARRRLRDRGVNARDRFLLTGFSASGTFANRFTLLHPERVLAVAAGGLNGLLMLPADSLAGEGLNYPLGTGDLEQLTGREFQYLQFRDTPQFYFIGGLDENDAIPYEDAYSIGEREQVYRLLGEQILPGRWEKCLGVYNDLNINVAAKTYESLGHEYTEGVKADVLEFFKEQSRVR